VTGPFPYGDQSNNRPHSNDHSKHGQAAAQFVQPKAFEADLNDTENG